MRGLTHVSRTEQAVNEARMSARHTCKYEHDAHMSTVVDPWIPISLVDTEMANMDPKSWKEAMTSYDVAEWVEGFKEEMISL